MGFFGCCRVRRCCCCTLRFGTISLAILICILSAVGIIYFAQELFYRTGTHEEEVTGDPPAEGEEEEDIQKDNDVLIALLILLCCVFLASFFILFGVWTDYLDFLHIGAVFLAILLFITLLLILLYLYVSRKYDYPTKCLVILIWLGILAGLLSGTVCVVNSYKYERREQLDCESEYDVADIGFVIVPDC